MHTSVFLEEFLTGFQGCSLQIFVDGTLGAGGHARALLDAHPEVEHFFGFDRDASALQLCEERLSPYRGKVDFVMNSFLHMEEELEKRAIQGVDGIFLDLGVSSMQLDQAERGFSFNKDAPLDMRMDTNAELSAEDVVNTWSEERLAQIFRDYGELRSHRRLARALVEARHKKRITTTKQLGEVLLPHSPRKKKIHPLTLPFQALRICVNDELGQLHAVLPQCLRLLREGGRFGVISFHSLEDRIVKETFRDAARERIPAPERPEGFLMQKPIVRLLTKKPLIPSLEEQQRNPRSRSAKLRFVERI